MSNILVTAIGSFSADIVIKNLHQLHHRVVGIDIYPKEWVANSLSVDLFLQSPYASDREAYIDFINRICKEEDIEYILPLTDVEVDALSNSAPEKGILCFSAKDTIEICRDKYRLYQYLSEHGVQCLIPTEFFDPQRINEYDFPIVLKPRNGRSSQGLHYVSTQAELEYLAKHQNLENFVLQPRKEGRIVTVDVLRCDSFFMATPRVELLRTQNGAGTSVKVFQSEKIETISKEIANILGIRGCVNFEFICSNEDIFFLECNPRFSGGVAFSCMAGYDYITNHLRCFSHEKTDPVVKNKEIYIARKYTEYITG